MNKLNVYMKMFTPHTIRLQRRLYKMYLDGFTVKMSMDGFTVKMSVDGFTVKMSVDGFTVKM